MTSKRRLPFLRSSFWRLAVGLPHFVRTGQIGDGRELACAAYVEANARRGDVDDRITCVVGTIGDGGLTLGALSDEHGFGAESVDLLFIDHEKSVYLADLQTILDRGWLHRGSIAVADNVRVPGAPKYRAYMREQQGKLWNTVEHKTHVEYQTLIPDLVLESEYLAG